MTNTIEIDRYMTVKGFWKLCEKKIQEVGDSLENWTGTFEEWARDGSCNDGSCSMCNHTDWDEPKYEICCTRAYECQYFLSGTYNFILSFDFTDEKHGFGYFFYNV